MRLALSESTAIRLLSAGLRSYQGWMGGALERMGFSRLAEQAVMVRRVAATVRRAAPAALPAISRGRVEPTTPFAGVHSEPRGSGRG